MPLPKRARMGGGTRGMNKEGITLEKTPVAAGQ